MKQPIAVALMFTLTVATPAAAATAPATPDTLARIVPVAPIEVSTSRANARSPLAQSTLTREQLKRLDWGQDTPMALASLPGAYATSDAGNGIGYSYLSIRGFPQRRIAVLINGVPLNDPESHEVYWIDHPDLLASTSSLQLQRGAGPALYGSAAIGGSVDLSTAPIDDAPHSSASVQYGTFATKRLMLESSSGRLPGGWGVYGRYSRIQTDGYRDQSWSKLWSYAVSAERLTPTQRFRVNLYGGPENTHLSYLGLSPDYFAGAITGDASRDRRANLLSFAGEQDHFFEPHYEFLHTWTPSPHVTLTQTAFWFDGSGYYDEGRSDEALANYRLAPIATTDTTLYSRTHYEQDGNGVLVRDSLGRALIVNADIVRRRNIDNRHFGWVPRVRMDHAHGALTLGGELRAHDGHHVGSLLSADPLPPGTAPQSAYYDYKVHTLAASAFAREEWDASSALRVTADLAFRHQAYKLLDDRFDHLEFDQSYDFALPRLGVNYTACEQLSAFASYAYASREPAFRDLFDGEYVGDTPLYATTDPASGTYRDPLVKPEHVHDLEAGAQWHGAAGSVGVNVFRMDFRDELVDAGQYNTDLGYAILGNASHSIHQGVELEGRTARTFGEVTATLAANATLSDNHFVRYTAHYGPTATDDVVSDGKQLGFFPAQMANVTAGARGRWLGASATFQYAGRIYVDNTETRFNSMGPRRTIDIELTAATHIAGARVEASLRGFNVTDARYATNGYMDYDTNGGLVPTLVPAATRAWLGGVRVDW
jgi:iron complex outermembrane receptor protein